MVQGRWEWRGTTGYKYVTPPVISDASVTKTPGVAGTEVWGPYKKTYVKSMFGQNLFTPPDTVDGVPILCRCRFINQYMRGPESKGIYLGAAAALVAGTHRPACWEDGQTIMNPQGGDTYNVTIGHPAFYSYALNRGGLVGLATGFRGFGGKSRKHRRNKRGKTMKRRN